MRQSFFGQYLVGKGILSREQLFASLELQSQYNRKIGNIAVDFGMMTCENVEAVLVAQKKDGRIFGELAQEMEFVNTEQLQRLLAHQQSEHKRLEQILIHHNFLHADIVKRELQVYAESKKNYDDSFDLQWIGSNINDGKILELFIGHTLQLIGRLGNMEVKQGEARFDREYLEDLDILIVDEILGDRPLRYLFNTTTNIISLVANGLMGAQGTYLSDGLCLDAGCEFVNIVCGNVIGQLARRGISLEITPPQVKKFQRRYNYRFSKREDSLVVPIIVPEGAVEVAIAGEDLYQVCKD